MGMEKGESLEEGGKEVAAVFPQAFFSLLFTFDSPRKCVYAPKGINPLPPLKAKGCPSRTKGGKKEEEAVETAFELGVLH